MALRRDFLSQVFHDLSQPLTALQCSLELALVGDQTLAEYRTAVEAALHNAERLRRRLLLLRELSDAEDPGDISVPVALDQLLRQLREDMLPLFETAGRSFELTCEAAIVPANETKLMRAFFYLLEFLLRCASPNHGLNLIGAHSSKKRFDICIEGCRACLNPDPADDCLQPDWTGELEIARRTFCAIGGELKRMPGPPSVWCVQLPCLS